MTRYDPQFVLGCALFVLIGVLIAGFAIVAADIYVPDNDFIADTISEMAAGHTTRWIADLGIYGLALAVLAAALGCAHIHPGHNFWSFGTGALGIMAFVIFMIGVRDEYGDGDSEGIAIHIYLVYALGALMAAAPLLLSRAAGLISHGHLVALRILGILWIVAAPIFFFVPDSVDGLYERGLGVIAGAILLTIASLLRKAAHTL